MFSTENIDFYSLIFIILCSVFIFLVIKRSKKLQFRNLILIGFVLRIFLMFADYYQWFPIPNSGTDSEMFHNIALQNQISSVQRFWTNYTYFLTFLYNITDSSRLIAQYINVLFGLGVLIFVQLSLSQLAIDKNTQKKAMLIIVFLPNLIIFSGILMREAWVEFFAAASLFYFVRWFKKSSAINILLSIIMLMSAVVMHIGTIGLIFGYIIAFITYNPNKQKVQLSWGNVIVVLVFIAGLSILLVNYSDIFISKLKRYDFDDPETLVRITNKSEGGGSDYLTWIKADNVTQSLLLSPLKIFYFLFSPLPTEWRDITDIIGFFFDGAIYMWLFFSILFSKHLQGIKKTLKMYLMITILIVVFIYAYGTTNAGTAFRHRAKIMPLIILTYAVSSVNCNKKKEFKLV